MIVVGKMANHAQEVLGLGDRVRAGLKPVGLLQGVLHLVVHLAGCTDLPPFVMSCSAAGTSHQQLSAKVINHDSPTCCSSQAAARPKRLHQCS